MSDTQKGFLLTGGFTLVEIMIVVAILGILAGLAFPNYIQARKHSQAKVCIANLKSIEGATEQYMMLLNTTDYSVVKLEDIAGGSEKLLKIVPICPAGGTYTLPTQNERAKCSLASDGHELVAPYN